MCVAVDCDPEAPFEVCYVWKSLSSSALNVFVLSSCSWGHGGSPRGWQGRASPPGPVPSSHRPSETDGGGPSPINHGGTVGLRPGPWGLVRVRIRPSEGNQVHHSPVITGQGHGDDAGPRSSPEVTSGSGLVTVTRVSHGPMMAGQARGVVARLRPGGDVSLGVKARISVAVAVHRQSWGCIWGCS